jgi:hypothetical protein
MPESTSMTTQVLSLAKTLASNKEQAMSGLTVASCLLNTLINMIVLDRVFTKVYMLNVKQAFNTRFKQRAIVKYQKSEKLMQVDHEEVVGFA